MFHTFLVISIVDFEQVNVVHCAIWYDLHNLKNVKNTHGGVLILALKLTLLHWCFSRSLHCTNDTKPSNVSQMLAG